MTPKTAQTLKLVKKERPYIVDRAWAVFALTGVWQ